MRSAGHTATLDADARKGAAPHRSAASGSRRLQEDASTDHGGQTQASARAAATHFKVTAISGSSDTVDIKLLERAASHHATRMTTWDDLPTGDHHDRARDLKRSGIILPPDLPPRPDSRYGERAFQSMLADAALTQFTDGPVTLFVDEAGQARSRPEAAERMAWAALSERLWQDIATHEGPGHTHRRLASARVISAALPAMVSLDAQADIVRGFAWQALTPHGAVLDWTIHDNGTGNPQALMMSPTRLLDDLHWGEKVMNASGRRDVSLLRRAWDRNVLLVIERERGRT